MRFSTGAPPEAMRLGATVNGVRIGITAARRAT